MHHANRIAGGLCAGLLVALLAGVAGGAAAQDGATLAPYAFAAPFTPAPDLCATERISTDVVAELVATPVAVPALATSDNGIVALPGGVPADEAATAAVLDILTQLWACNNASDSAAVLALFTEQAIQETAGNTEGASWDLAELRADVAAALTPGDPRPAEEWASIDGIVSILAESDGRIGVLVLNSDPLVAEGDQVLDYFAFSTEGDGAKVAQIILDPFDLTAGYGFEK
jgi:hypothetical protein